MTAASKAKYPPGEWINSNSKIIVQIINYYEPDKNINTRMECKFPSIIVLRIDTGDIIPLDDGMENVERT